MLSFGSIQFNDSTACRLSYEICKRCLIRKNRCLTFGNIYSTCVQGCNDKRDSENDDAFEKFTFIGDRKKKSKRLKNDDPPKESVAEQPQVNSRDLETFWKLYREPNEAVDDVKNRLVDLRKKEDKQRIESNEDDESEEDSTSEATDNNDSEEESTSESISIEQLLLPDYLEVEILEGSDLITLPCCDTLDLANGIYDVPRISTLTRPEEIQQVDQPLKQRPLKRSAQQRNKLANAARRRSQPIIINMYGIRTVNYNDDYYLDEDEMRYGKRFETTRLSATSDEEVVASPRQEARQAKKRSHAEVVCAPLNLSSESEETDAGPADICATKRQKLEDCGIESGTNGSSTRSSSSSSCSSSSCSCSCSSSSSRSDSGVSG